MGKIVSCPKMINVALADELPKVKLSREAHKELQYIGEVLVKSYLTI